MNGRIVRQSAARKVLKPQPDEKKPRRKTLKEAVTEVKEEIRDKVRNDARRRLEDAARAEEEAVALMIFGPQSR